MYIHYMQYVYVHVFEASEHWFTHVLRSPLTVDCTEWISIVYPHVEISPSL